MKILVIYHSGALLNAMAIYRALSKNRSAELTVALPECVSVHRVYHPSGRLQVNPGDHVDGFRLAPVPLADPNRYYLGFDTSALKRIIKENRPDILHVWDEPVSYSLLQAAWLRIPFSPRSKVLFYGFENIPPKWGATGRLIWKTTWTQIAGGAAANSEALSNLRQAGFPRSRPTERIFWGVSTELFKPMDKISLKQELKLDCDYIVGYVGRLVLEKGLAWLLAAMKQLPANVHCLIMGSGPMRGELELWSELPSLAGRVHVQEAKPAEELPQYVNCMDVLALPSLTTALWKEQYGRAIAEAMACGVPVVGSDSGAIPEVVDSAGLIVPEGDVSRLADALSSAIFSEVRGRLTRQGFQRSQEELSVAAMSQRLFSFYERILET